LARSYHSLILGLQGFADQAIHGIECNLVDVRGQRSPGVAVQCPQLGMPRRVFSSAI